MKVLLLLVGVFTGCTTVNLPPSSKQEQSQRQQQEQSQSSSNTNSQGQDSAHASDSRQGTVSQPIIIICNQMSSPSGNCVTPKDSNPILRPFKISE